MEVGSNEKGHFINFSLIDDSAAKRMLRVEGIKQYEENVLEDRRKVSAFISDEKALSGKKNIATRIFGFTMYDIPHPESDKVYSYDKDGREIK